MSRAGRELVERKLKEMLLRAAERAGVDPRRLAEWLYEEHGVRVARAEWRGVRRAVLRSSVTAQELAVFLMDEGVEVDEAEWIETVRRYSIGEAVPRIPSPVGRRGRAGGGGAGEAGGEEAGEGEAGSGSGPPPRAEGGGGGGEA